MVDQMNRWIHSGQGFIGSFDLLIRVISDHWSWSRWSQWNAPIYLRISIECFHSRRQHPGLQIYWNKRKRLHKKRVQLPQDWFGTPIWFRFYCFGTPIWPPWRHVKITALLVPSGLFFQPRSCPEKMKPCTLRVWNKIIEHSIIQHISLLYLSSYLKSLISIRIKLLFVRCFPLMRSRVKWRLFFSVSQVYVLRNKRKKRTKYSNANWLEVKIKWRTVLSQEYTLHFNQKRRFIHTNYNRTSISWNKWWPV